MTTKFQQRHYEAIAAEFQEAKRMSLDFAHESNSGRVESEFARGWDAAVEYFMGRLANEFARDNYNFDRGRFERACVPGANVRARTA